MRESNEQQLSAEASASSVRGDTSKVLDELSRSNSAKVRAKRNGLRRFAIVVVLMLPLLLAISFLIFEQSRTDAILAELRSKDAALEEALARAPSALSTPAVAFATPPAQFTLPENLADTRMLNELSANLDSRINALARNTDNLQERIGVLSQARGNVDWMWTEAEYLLRLANQKLQLEGDGESALLILNAVDEMLRDSGEVSVLGVRELLSGEMLAVRNMDSVDVSALYMRLNNLMPMIEELSLREAMIENYNTQLAQARNELALSDESMFDRGLAMLKSIFVWQNWDVDHEALLPPPQEAVLKQNLHLMLEQAQLSLLLAEPLVFADSLKKGAQWTDRYFAIDMGAGRTLKEELDKLAELNIIETRPDISGSLELLRRVDPGRNQSFANDDL